MPVFSLITISDFFAAIKGRLDFWRVYSGLSLLRLTLLDALRKDYERPDEPLGASELKDVNAARAKLREAIALMDKFDLLGSLLRGDTGGHITLVADCFDEATLLLAKVKVDCPQVALRLAKRRRGAEPKVIRRGGSVFAGRFLDLFVLLAIEGSLVAEK
jgi:hypothetical protein